MLKFLHIFTYFDHENFPFLFLKNLKKFFQGILKLIFCSNPKIILKTIFKYKTLNTELEWCNGVYLK